MKNIAPNRNIKIKARTMVEFHNVIKTARFKEEACVTLRDKKRNVFSGNMRIGTFADAYELCTKSDIVLISYQAIH